MGIWRGRAKRAAVDAEAAAISAWLTEMSESADEKFDTTIWRPSGATSTGHSAQGCFST